MTVTAKDMALAINGGDWDTDYTEAQKRGWQLKADYCNAQPVTPQDAARVLLEGLKHRIECLREDGWSPEALTAIDEVLDMVTLATPPQEKDDADA